MKFRFWDHIEKKMLYCSPIAGANQYFIDANGIVWQIIPGHNIRCTPHIIPLAYIGIDDKNGKPIYEGDTVFGVDNKYKIVFHNGAFQLDTGEHYVNFIYSHIVDGKHTRLRVVSNIYENAGQALSDNVKSEEITLEAYMKHNEDNIRHINERLDKIDAERLKELFYKENIKARM